ncbi:hypothetical protein HYU07_06865 [Candidatus Woesearchaeota archaeon]|nr:hypothetical protein [Candidatus Woesearchaeota archaeon]
MDIAEIKAHYTAKRLEEVAKKLSKSDALKMYGTMESIARIIVGEAAFCAATATDNELKKLAKEHLGEASVWADYLAQQEAEYRE